MWLTCLIACSLPLEVAASEMVWMVGVRWPVAGEHLLARDVKLHRHARSFRRHGGEQDVRPERAFAAECAAHERANDADVFQIEPVGCEREYSARL